MKNKLIKLYIKKIKEEPTSIEDGNKKDYLEKCFKDYLNDQFNIEQSLFLFSCLIKRGIAWNFTEDISETADDFIETGWIDTSGKILISAEEANRFVEENIGDIK